MSLIQTNRLDELKNYTGNPDNKVVLMISATFCPPCRQFTPLFTEVSDEFKGKVLFIKVNIDENPTVNEWIRVGSVPTLVYWRGGKEIYRVIGGCSKEELIERVKQLFF